MLGKSRVASVIVVLAAAAVIVFAFASAAPVLLAPKSYTPVTNPIDFLAFYCVGRVGTSADPYLAEPLRSCEAAALATSNLHIVPNLVVPGPLPPYAIAALTPLAQLPFRAASMLWLLVMLASAALTAVLLRRLTGLSPLLLLLPILLADAFASLVIGQFVPLVVCILCAAALALRSGRAALASVLAAGTLFEPHVGLPLCLALFLWQPATRRTLALCAAFLVLLSLAYGGVAENLEYVARVVPAQARAEGLSFNGQYSLSALLAQFGVAENLALELGALSYLLTAGLGVALAGRLARALGDVSLVAFTPPAFALIGGAYVHIHQMAFALPLAFTLFAKRTPWRPLLAVALFCLAIPWQSLAEMPLFNSLLPPHPHVDVQATLRPLNDGSRLAEDEWGAWQRLAVRDRRTPAQRLATKLPTWLGLLVLAGAALALARSGDRYASSRAEPARRDLRSMTRA
ncbi:MAG TPA: glycosyltransferase family 87 protein [Candidatus Baltobacteraceae bacterium]|nr:glycosyltransferase family 87 protein [Candidatus Baltobacteraceae bacterium]